MKKLSVRDLDVRNRRVFVRVDFNVPLADGGTISTDARIRASLPTINFLLKRRATVVLASHLGKPDGKPDPKLSLKVVADRLAELLDRPVVFAPDCIGKATRQLVTDAAPGSVILLENLRFHPGEVSNDPEFSRELAGLAERYVNDAFGTAHRSHASTVGVAGLFDRPAAGLLMEEEIRYLASVLESPDRPHVAIIGGSKVKDKAGVIANLLPQVDKLLIGGGLMFDFLKGQGLGIGKSIFKPDTVRRARELAENPKLVLPVDVVVAPDPDSPDKAHAVPVDAIPDDEMGLDIGPKTIELFRKVLADARTVVWAGPLGMFEKDAFATGTNEIARAVAALTETGATTVVGGGDTLAALSRAGLRDKVSHVSTGGGACLQFLEGRILPGIRALADAHGATRTPIIAGNWKMHKTATVARAFCIKLRPRLADVLDRQILIFPPFTALAAVADELDRSRIGYGGQDCHWEAEGAFTGAVSPAFLRDLGCTHVLVGHSERRHVFGDSDDICNRKVRAALAAGLIPVFCCGEKLDERENELTFATLERQLSIGLRGFKEQDELVIAYEPVWAIGTGRTATPEQAQEVHRWIRSWLVRRVSVEFADRTPILYGGSVKPDNVDALMAETHIDGVLVGGASLEVESFERLVRFQA
ncbi:triose-phosphate isomerase [candidate division WOR-3 bacterium]|nr:triose-phosphate isomerase [candidate division WOR-3 bacterium]